MASQRQWRLSTRGQVKAEFNRMDRYLRSAVKSKCRIEIGDGLDFMYGHLPASRGIKAFDTYCSRLPARGLRIPRHRQLVCKWSREKAATLKKRAATVDARIVVNRFAQQLIETYCAEPKRIIKGARSPGANVKAAIRSLNRDDCSDAGQYLNAAHSRLVPGKTYPEFWRVVNQYRDRCTY